MFQCFGEIFLLIQRIERKKNWKSFFFPMEDFQRKVIKTLTNWFFLVHIQPITKSFLWWCHVLIKHTFKKKKKKIIWWWDAQEAKALTLLLDYRASHRFIKFSFEQNLFMEYDAIRVPKNTKPIRNQIWGPRFQ